MKGDLEKALRTGIAEPQDWEKACERFIRSAKSEELVDVAVTHYDSPFGLLLIGATERGVVRIALPNEREEEVLEGLVSKISPRILITANAANDRLRQELDQYFQGTRREFDIEVDWQLVRGFRQEVLRETALIPYGETVSYREVAGRAGSPAAVRAAGTALATNPIPIVVPCHRVLRSDGGLGGYRGGLDVKRELLALESGS